MSKTPAVPQTALEAAGAVVTGTSLTLVRPDVTWEEYERLGAFIGETNRACSWWVGDLVIAGEQIFGHIHAQIQVALDIDPQTISNRASVARRIPPEKRIASLPFSTHAEVAYLPPRERDKWLKEAERNHWTRSQLRLAMGKDQQPKEIALDDDRTIVGPLPPPSPEFDKDMEDLIRVLTCPHCGEDVPI